MQRVMSHIRMRYVTIWMLLSMTGIYKWVCGSFICVALLIYVCLDVFIYMPWLIHMWAMTHSYMCHDSFTCEPWRIHMFAVTQSYVCPNAFIYMCRESFSCVLWLIHMCAMTHSYVYHDAFICVPQLIHICAMTHLYVRHWWDPNDATTTYNRLISISDFRN